MSCKDEVGAEADLQRGRQQKEETSLWQNATRTKATSAAAHARRWTSIVALPSFILNIAAGVARSSWRHVSSSHATQTKVCVLAWYEFQSSFTSSGTRRRRMSV